VKPYLSLKRHLINPDRVGKYCIGRLMWYPLTFDTYDKFITKS